MLRVRREKKKRGNKYAEQLLRVRKTRIVEGTKTREEKLKKQGCSAVAQS